MTRYLFATGASLLAVALAAPAQAQQATVPSAPTREELLRESVPEAPASGVRVRSDDAFVPGPCPLEGSDVRVTLSSVTYDGQGGTPLPPALVSLLAGITPPPGEQAVSVVCAVRDQAQAALRRAGYVASVQIPQQRIDGGVLRLEVITGRIAEVRVRGNAGPYESLLRSRIEQLRAIDPLNENDAKRVLVLANDIPGMTVQLNLSPGGGMPGELIGELTVSYRPWSLFANVQNYNATYLGRETAFLRGELYGLTGLGDMTAIAVSSTFDFREQKIGQIAHTMTVNGNGDTLSATATYARSRPTLDTLDLRTTSLVGTAEYARMLARTITTAAELAGGFEVAEQRTKVYNGGTVSPLNLDKIAAVYLRLAGQTRRLRFDGSQQSSLSGSIELRKGLDVFGATKPINVGGLPGGFAPSRAEGDARSEIVRASVDGSVGFGPIFEMSARARAQWASDPLLNYDEFSLGNLTVGRGYDPGSNSGDRAVAFSVEPRANVVFSPDAFGQFYAFYDGVRLWNLDTNTTEAKRYLDSVGGGFRLTLMNMFRLDVAYVKPLDPPLLTGTTSKKPNDRVLFSLTAQFGPTRR